MIPLTRARRSCAPDPAGEFLELSGPAILYDHDLINAAKYDTLGNGTRWLAQARQLRHGADERTRQELHRVVALDRRGLDRVGYAPIPCRTVAAAPAVLPAGGWRRYYPWRASPDQNRRAAARPAASGCIAELSSKWLMMG